MLHNLCAHIARFFCTQEAAVQRLQAAKRGPAAEEGAPSTSGRRASKRKRVAGSDDEEEAGRVSVQIMHQANTRDLSASHCKSHVANP